MDIVQKLLKYWKTRYNETRKSSCQQRFGKSGGSLLADKFAVNQTMVLRINICSENCHFRQAQNVIGKEVITLS